MTVRKEEKTDITFFSDVGKATSTFNMDNDFVHLLLYREEFGCVSMSIPLEDLSDVITCLIDIKDAADGKY